MLYYDRIDISEGIDPTESDRSKKCVICHYWFLIQEFKFQDSVSNGCQDLTILCLNTSHIAIITVDYYCIILNISKFEAINLLQNYVLKYRGYI